MKNFWGAIVAALLLAICVSGCRIAAEKDFLERLGRGQIAEGNDPRIVKNADGTIVLSSGGAVPEGYTPGRVENREGESQKVVAEKFGMTCGAVWPLGLPGEQMARKTGHEIDKKGNIKAGGSSWTMGDAFGAGVRKYASWIVLGLVACIAGPIAGSLLCLSPATAGIGGLIKKLTPLSLLKYLPLKKKTTNEKEKSDGK